MAKATVSIGCKLPHGIILQHPMDPNNKVELRGKNKVTIIGADYAVTQVDAEFWESWVAVNKEFAPFLSGAIFVGKNEAAVADTAKELAKTKTGFEQMQTDGKDPRASGVKTADNKE